MRGKSSSLFLLNASALLGLGGISSDFLLRSSVTLAADGLTVMSLIPLSEGRGIDLNDGGLGQGVVTDQLVVGWVEDNVENADLAGETLRTPREVAGFETESAEFLVATTRADKMDALRADTGVGWLTTLFKGSGK